MRSQKGRISKQYGSREENRGTRNGFEILALIFPVLLKLQNYSICNNVLFRLKTPKYLKIEVLKISSPYIIPQNVPIPFELYSFKDTILWRLHKGIISFLYGMFHNVSFLSGTPPVLYP